MTTEKAEEVMTFGELLALISDQQRRITVMETAFSSLAWCLDERASQLLIHQLTLESTSQKHDAALQQQFALLVTELEKRHHPAPDAPTL